MEENKQTELKIRDLWGVFKDCCLIALIVALVVTGGLYIVLHKTHQPEYTAKATIWSLRTSPDPLSSQDVAIGGALSNDYCILIMDDSVVEEVIKRVGGMECNAQNIAALKKKAKVENEPDTRVLYLSITDQNAKRAAEIANAWSDVFCEKINAIVGEDQIDLVDVFSRAQVPQQPSNQLLLWKFVLIGAAIAILVYAAFLVRFLLNDRLTTPSDIEEHLGLSVLGAIPDYNSGSAKNAGSAEK